MDNVQAKIVDRLERYTGHGHEAATEIARQVLIALDIDDGSDLIVTTSAKQNDEMDRQYAAGEANGRRAGYMKAMDHVIANLPTTGPMRDSIADLRDAYLDTH